MSINIKDEVESITAQIIKKYGPEKIILFGSAAKGELYPESDADFLIIKRNIPVDFLIYRPDEFNKRLSMGDPFLKSIIKEGKVLYEG